MCQRYPPAPVYIDGKIDGWADPPTSSDHWCGEYSATDEHYEQITSDLWREARARRAKLEEKGHRSIFLVA